MMGKRGDNLYLKRKCGSGMGWTYVLRALSPAVLIMLVTTILVFSYVFIYSMTSAIDRMIMVLGSGTLSVKEVTLPEGLPESWKCDYVKSGEGILYSAEAETLVKLKGVEADYFLGERGELLKLEREDLGSRNYIILSSSLSSVLKVGIGDRMTLLLYDETKGRTRPLLMTVEGIFDSGYAQLDRYMAYTSSSLLEGDGSWEILLPEGENLTKAGATLIYGGVVPTDYREEYSSLYLNVSQSVSILYVILLAVAVLAAFFSVDIALVYTSRDRRDIAALRLLGAGEGHIRNIYVSMTLYTVAAASLLGTMLGLVLGNLSPLLMKLVAGTHPEIVENYIASFAVKVPVLPVLLMLLGLLLFSFLSLELSLRFTARKELSQERLA